MPPAETMVDGAGNTWWSAGLGDKLRLEGGSVYRIAADGSRDLWIGSAWEPVAAPPPSPPLTNRAPIWPAGETPLEFISGVSRVVRLADFPSDPDGDTLRLSLKSGTFGPGFIYDEPSDELRFDGRELPTGQYGMFTVLADDGRA